MKQLYGALITSVFILCAAPFTAHAATISVVPASGSYAVGDAITARIAVSTDVSVNAVSASLSFSNDTLSLLSISKSGSFLSFWAQEPSYSNANGTASLEGVSLGTGYTGTNGTVVTLTFRAKAAGDASVSFDSASVLANDGQGTDVTNARNGAAFTIGAGTGDAEAPATDSGPAPSSAGVPITSPTHPDSKKWYDNDSPQFAWKLPSGADEVRTGLDSSSAGTPTKSYAPAISSKTVDNLSDGTYYFHLQVHTPEGWSAVSHYAVHIDTTQPRSFSITFPYGSASIEPQPVMLFNTTDAVSGIDHYEIRVGDGGPLTVTNSDVSQNPYALPLMEPGHYVAYVTAYDLAGNTTTAESEFTVEGIDPPKVTSYPAELSVGDVFKVSGTTYADADVELTVFDKDGDQVAFETGKSNSLNNFTIVLSKRLLPGAYTFTLRAIDARGARSPATDPLPFKIDFHVIGDVLAFVANYFVIVVIFVLAVAGVAAVGIWSFYRLAHLSTLLKKERTEAETTIKKAFRLLKHDLEDHIARLHRARTDRTLTAEELAFLEQFEKDLHEAEDIIKDEFDDIPKG